MNKTLTEKEYSENYEIFKKANNRIKEMMINNGLIDLKEVMKKLPIGTSLTQTKFKI